MSKRKPPDRYLTNRNRHRKVRDFVDFDYVDDLSLPEQEWLARFAREYYDASFKHKRKLHRKGRSRNRCYNDDHARRRDVWNKWERVSANDLFFGDEREWDDDDK